MAQMRRCSFIKSLYKFVSRLWFEIFLCLPLFREDFQFDSYFSDVLKPPTRYVGTCAIYFKAKKSHFFMVSSGNPGEKKRLRFGNNRRIEGVIVNPIPNQYPYCWWFRNPANQLRLVIYPSVYRVLYIPGGAGFLPSTVPSTTHSIHWNWKVILGVETNHTYHDHIRTYSSKVSEVTWMSQEVRKWLVGYKPNILHFKVGYNTCTNNLLTFWPLSIHQDEVWYYILGSNHPAGEGKQSDP